MRTFSTKEPPAHDAASSGVRQFRLARPSTNASEHPLLHLQRTIGNQAVQRMLHTDRQIQAKLTVGQPNDSFEQEADRVANAVVEGQTTPVQRMCAECEEQAQRSASLDGQGPAEDELDGQQAPAVGHAVAGGQRNSARVMQQIDATRGIGQPLPETTQHELGHSMGADFSRVRVHTDSAAAGMCGQLNAHAFTTGRDIYFNRGRYDTQSAAGKHLLAHELTHTLQQDDGTLRRLSITPTKSFTTGPCGARSVFWNFASAVAAPASGGYIVQHVRNMETTAVCPDDVEGVLTTPKDQFWEAWWVAPGDKIQQLHKSGVVDFTDNSKRPSTDGDGKSEHQASVGEVRFFSKDTTGDLGKEDVLSSDPKIAADWKPGTKGGVARSGWLPSTASQPAWWGNSLDGPAKRWANSWWNCCDKDASKHWSKSDADPK